MPYAYGATIRHEFLVDHLNIWVTFRHPMQRSEIPQAEPPVYDWMPPLNLWLLETDAVPVDITDSEWQDEFTLLLTSDALGVYPERVLLEYNGPNSNLQTTWGKDWEPWGPILSTDIGRRNAYVDRGDPANWDFTEGDLTKDWAWHELDLSAIIPENATAVAIHIQIKATTVSRQVILARNGNTEIKNVSDTMTQAGNIGQLADIVVPVDADRKIQYRIQVATWTYINACVKGWWF